MNEFFYSPLIDGTLYINTFHEEAISLKNRKALIGSNGDLTVDNPLAKLARLFE